MIVLNLDQIKSKFNKPRSKLKNRMCLVLKHDSVHEAFRIGQKSKQVEPSHALT